MARVKRVPEPPTGEMGDSFLPGEIGDAFVRRLDAAAQHDPTTVARLRQRLAAVATLPQERRRAALLEGEGRQDLSGLVSLMRQAAEQIGGALELAETDGVPLPPEEADADPEVDARVEKVEGSIGDLMELLRELMLVLDPQRAPLPSVPSIFRDGLASIAYANNATWAVLSAIHDAPAQRQWSDYDGASAPTHVTRTNKGRGAVYVSLRGPDGASRPDIETLPKLWEQVRAMSDLTSDAFLCCLAIGATKSGGPKEPFWITADAILDARGIKRIKRKGEPGNWQHGHRREDRIEAGRALAQLENAWLKIVDVEVIPGRANRKAKRIQVESRALAILDRASQQEIDGGTVFLGARVAFGEWASEWWQLGLHQTALLAQKALEYDPYREQPEKRLTKYLAFHFRWHAQKGEGRLRRKVEDLLGVVGIEPKEHDPQRARDRLERALDRLRGDGVTADWSYTVEAAPLPARKWLGAWLEMSVWIDPPERVINRYLKRDTPRPAALLT